MPYIGKSPVTGNYNSLDDMSGSFNSSTTTFNLLVNSGTALTPVRAEALIISINGVIQEPGTDFTVSAATLTYTTAPASTDSFFGVVLGQQLDIATPADGTVSTAKIADGAVNMAKLGATVTIAKGGTGATAAAAAFTALASTQATVGNGSAAAPAITSSTATSDSGIYFPAADTVGVVSGGTEQFRFGSNPIPGGSKNMLINGAMTISQKGSVAAMGAGSGPYQTALDMWRITEVGAQGRITTTQDATSPAGFGYSLKCDCTTAESTIASGDLFTISSRIEAQNLQHLQYGAATAENMTLSFWFRSPKSGTHCVALEQSDATRSYVAEFTISSADTFEFFSITIPGDASGTINNDTGTGLAVHFPLFAGTNSQATAGAWASGYDTITSNQQNLLDSTSNNVYIAGVQLEVGSVATDFAHEDVGTTVAKCQRYLWLPVYGDSMSIKTGAQMSTTQMEADISFPVQMRAAPSFTLVSTGGLGNGVQLQTQDGASAVWSTAVTWQYASKNSGWLRASWSGGIGSTNEAIRLYSASAATRLYFSAEL